jgi:iron complex outermembrane receptor protein
VKTFQTHLLAAAVLLAATQAAAQDAAIDEMPLSDGALPAPMLAPTGMRQPIRDIPASVIILPGELLANFGILSITEGLRLVGGMAPKLLGWSGYDLRLGRKNTVDPERLTVLIDGIEVDATLLESTNLSSLPVGIDDVERIEISSGASTAGYGHALSTAIINIVTRHPADVERAYARLSTGSYDNNTVFGRAGATFGPSSVRLTLTHHQRGPLDEESLSPVRSSGLTFDRVTLRSSTRFDVGTFEFDAAYLNGNGTGVLSSTPALEGNLRNGYASAVWSTNPTPTDEVNIRFDHWFDDQNLASTTCGTQQVEQAAFSPDAATAPAQAPGSVPTSGTDDAFSTIPSAKPRASCKTDLRERRTILELQDVHVAGDALRFVGGFGARMEQADDAAPGAGTPPWAANFLRAYGGVDWRVTPAVTLNAGASADHAGPENYDTSVRAGVNWHLSDEQTLRSALTYGRWASDTNTALEVPGLVVTGERMTSADIGYLLSLPARNASLTARLFWQRLEGDVVNTSADDSPERNANGNIYGFESRATAGITACCAGYLSLSYSSEGDNSGVHVPGNNWVAQGAIGVSGAWGAGWRTSAAWYGSSNDSATGMGPNVLGLALIKDFTWLASRFRVTLTYRHNSGNVETNTGFASLTVAY